VSTLTLDRLSKRYRSDDREVVAVDGLSLQVGDGELLVLVGPSGCGKSTALRMIAGLEEITGGELTIDGERMNERDSSERDIAMVFQNYALYPHMSVYRNIAYPLRIQKKSRAEIDQRVRETARILQLTDLLDRRPGALSGGQRQRVAMGRALIRRPKAFLMDEPLSNLDAKLRVQMRAEITAIQRQVNVTTVYVTHDQVEAMTMGDRVAVMRDGVLQQVATPTELFWWPANTFVASFIGSPPMNLFAATVKTTGTGVDIAIGSQSISLTKKDLAAHPGLLARGAGPVIVGMRPEHLGMVADDAKGPMIRGKVTMVEHLGTELICHADIGGDRLTDDELEAGEDAVAVPDNALVARIQSKAPLEVGARVTFSINAEELRFFDPETNDALR
jgi:multiple sugar transport system ATP-binding protein